jgi:Xaa-Pro aminopeptidase
MERWVRVRAEVRKHGWDALWVTRPANRRYLTGFTGSAGWVLVPAAGRPVLLTDGRYTIQARQQAGSLRRVITRREPHIHLAALLKTGRNYKLGFEDAEVSVSLWRLLKQALPRIKGFTASGLVERLREHKDPGEVASLRAAVRCAEAAFRSLTPKLRPGITEQALAFELEKAIHRTGAEASAFPLIVASGPNGALPHATPSDRRLRAGDLVVLDFGCRYQGYHSDLTRTVAISRATTRQKEVYKTVKNAQETAQKHIISGQKICDCDKKARLVFKKAGLDRYFSHSLGHGIGLEVHELPRLSNLNQGIFQPGMVVTCEPGLYFPGWGGVRIEDDLLLTATRTEALSSSPRDLPILRPGR